MFEIDTMNAVPTPRLEVGENAFADQLLQRGGFFGKVKKSHNKFVITHYEGKETIQSSDNQEQCKICSTNAPLNAGSQYEISDKRYEAGDDNVPSSLSSLVAMPSL